MNPAMKKEIRRHLENALGELSREMGNQGGKTFAYGISDYAGGLTIKLEEVDAPAAANTEAGFALGSAKLNSATLDAESEDTPKDGGK